MRCFDLGERSLIGIGLATSTFSPACRRCGWLTEAAQFTAAIQCPGVSIDLTARRRTKAPLRPQRTLQWPIARRRPKEPR